MVLTVMMKKVASNPKQTQFKTECKNDTLYMTKMAIIDALFMTKTAGRNPYPLGPLFNSLDLTQIDMKITIN